MTTKTIFSLMAAAGAMMASTGAFASATYVCGQATNSQGDVLAYGFEVQGYQVEALDDGSVVLRELIGGEGRAWEVQDVGVMTKTSQEVEFASYELGHFQATVGQFFDGIWRTGATLTIKTRGGDYQANCK